jgi:hypothetical protein
MTVHRIQLYYSTTDAQTFHSWVADWNSTRDGDTGDELTNKIPDVPVDPRDDSNAEYYSAMLSYDFAEPPTEVLKDPYHALVDLCDWCRVGYHECDHDEDNPEPCAFTDDHVLEHGTIPDHVPTLL